MAKLEILQIPVLSDNYIYLIHDQATGETAVVDPAVASPVAAALDQKGWHLTHILNTHHHHDHTGGNEELKRATGCKIIGAGPDAARIPGIDVQVYEGDSIAIGDSLAQVFEIPGHTSGHIAYWFEEAACLFCGDTLFALGCGRLFEGTPQQMWTSLSKLRDLPDNTRVFCAHEYTEDNARFALTIDPDNKDLASRFEGIQLLRQAGQPTVPSLMAEEKATNPFLRADSPSLQKALGMVGDPVVNVFAEVRRRKDHF